MPTGRRFQITHQFTTIFADRLRIGAQDELGRFHLLLGATDAEAQSTADAMVTLDLPKNERNAYLRAAAAFNAIMNEAEQQHKRHLAGRRVRARVAAGGDLRQEMAREGLVQ